VAGADIYAALQQVKGPFLRKCTVKIGREIHRGGEFTVFEIEGDAVLKIPRFPRLMSLVFGDFQKKIRLDIQFLREHFPEFLPSTEIIRLEGTWAVRQQRIHGAPFLKGREMTSGARELLARAAGTFRETGKIPDLLRPENLLCETGTGNLYLVDTSVLGGGRSWPAGFLVIRIFGKMAFDSVRRRLRNGS
jgi:hypothetical protein